VLVNTNMGGAAGALTATLTAWLLLKKPDLSMTLNGCLAGLVAITAPCAFVSMTSGLIIGGSPACWSSSPSVLRQAED
jgi:Amt family ammonium transporter